MLDNNSLLNDNFDFISSKSNHIVEMIKPPTVTEHETSIEIPITREMLVAPLFARGKNGKMNGQQIYYLNPQKTRKIEISPKFNDVINTEFEERVFMALIDIAKRQQSFLGLTVLPRKIFATITLIIKTMGLKYKGQYKTRVHQALERLQQTRYVFTNCFYESNVEEFKDIEHTSILSSYNYKSFFEVENLNHSIIEFFGNDKRIHDFVIVEIAESFYRNLLNKKGYLNFDSRKLLSIENGVARKLYMFCDRNRWQDDVNYKEKGNDLQFRVSVELLVQIIPLVFVASARPKAVDILEKAFFYLKNHNLIVDYILHKEKPLKNSWFEVFFATSRKYEVMQNVDLKDFVVHTQETKFIHDNTDIKILDADKDNSDNLYQEDKWSEFLDFYFSVYDFSSKSNRDKINEYNQISQAKLIQIYEGNKFYAVKLANYVLDKGKDINAYLAGHGINQKFYINDNDVLNLQLSYELKLKTPYIDNCNNNLAINKSNLKNLHKKSIECIYNELSDKDKLLYVSHLEYIMQIHGEHLERTFGDKIGNVLVFCIYAVTNETYYDKLIESYIYDVLNCNLIVNCKNNF